MTYTNNTTTQAINEMAQSDDVTIAKTARVLQDTIRDFKQHTKDATASAELIMREMAHLVSGLASNNAQAGSPITSVDANMHKSLAQANDAKTTIVRLCFVLNLDSTNLFAELTEESK